MTVNLLSLVMITAVLSSLSGLPASVKDLDYPKEGVRALEPTELSFRWGETFENPDDPGEIEVLAAVTEPDGNRYLVPGFSVCGTVRLPGSGTGT